MDEMAATAKPQAAPKPDPHAGHTMPGQQPAPPKPTAADPHAGHDRSSAGGGMQTHPESERGNPLFTWKQACSAKSGSTNERPENDDHHLDCRTAMGAAGRSPDRWVAGPGTRHGRANRRTETETGATRSTCRPRHASPTASRGSTADYRRRSAGGLPGCRWPRCARPRHPHVRPVRPVGVARWW